jgi:hypothetical protein
MELKIFVVKFERYGLFSTMVGYNEEDAYKLSGKDPEEWKIVWKSEN